MKWLNLDAFETQKTAQIILTEHLLGQVLGDCHDERKASPKICNTIDNGADG